MSNDARRSVSDLIARFDGPRSSVHLTRPVSQRLRESSTSRPSIQSAAPPSTDPSLNTTKEIHSQEPSLNTAKEIHSHDPSLDTAKEIHSHDPSLDTAKEIHSHDTQFVESAMETSPMKTTKIDLESSSASLHVHEGDVKIADENPTSEPSNMIVNGDQDTLKNESSAEAASVPSDPEMTLERDAVTQEETGEAQEATSSMDQGNSAATSTTPTYHTPVSLTINKPINPNAFSADAKRPRQKSGFLQLIFGWGNDEDEMEIGVPFNVMHENHVSFNFETNTFQGLPSEWAVLLKSSGISKDEQRRDPQAVIDVMKFHHQINQQPSTSGQVAGTDKSMPPVANVDEIKIESLVSREDPTKIFSISRKIGEGASGFVFAARHSRLKKEVALKKIDMSNEANIKLIKAEVYNMKRARHPNIIEFLGSYLYGNEIWVALELMEGGSLTDIVTGSHQMTEAQIARVSLDILSAVEYLHREGFIHRDIKSDNILLGSKGEVKLADFGYCAQLTAEKTKRTSVVGTPYWMAPELIRGLEYGPKVDVWSIGVLLMEMVDGDPPYIDFPPIRALFLIATNGTPDFKKLDRVTPLIRAFSSVCLAVDPDRRASSEEALQHEFLKVACPSEGLVSLLQ